MSELSRNTRVICPPTGGYMSVIDIAGGEVLFDLPLQPGETTGARLQPFVGLGQTVEFSDGVVALEPPSRAAIIRHPEHDHSAMVEGFQPSPTERLFQMFDQRLKRSEAKSARMQAELEARIAAKGPAPAPEPVAPPEDAKPEPESEDVDDAQQR